MTRFALTLEFDGGPFMGLQRQAHGPTVQQAVEAAVYFCCLEALQNAGKHAGDGASATVAIERRPDGGAAGSLAFTVADDGRGIAGDELPRVFDRFHRADRSGSGTGIGLTIARSVARAHGGDVMARSPGPGAGSTFVVRLPVAGPTSAPDAAEGP